MRGQIHDPCTMGVGSSLKWQTHVAPWAQEVPWQ